MSIKEVASEIFKKIAIFFFKKSHEIEPEPIEINKIIKLESELDAYVNKLVNLIPEIEKARTGILSKLGEKLERMDKSLNEMAEKVDMMKVFTDAGDVDPERIRKIKELKDELQDVDLESIDPKSVEKYMVGLEVAKLVSKSNDVVFKSDDEIRERYKKVVEETAPAIFEEKIKEIEKEISARINELERKTLTNFDSKLINELEIRALHFRGLLEYKRGKYENALENFDKIIKIDPEIREAWLNRGAVLGKLGRYKEEIECYSKVLSKDEKYLDAWINKGIALIESGEVKKAEVCFKEAYETISTKQEIR